MDSRLSEAKTVIGGPQVVLRQPLVAESSRGAFCVVYGMFTGFGLEKNSSSPKLFWTQTMPL